MKSTISYHLRTFLSIYFLEGMATEKILAKLDSIDDAICIIADRMNGQLDDVSDALLFAAMEFIDDAREMISRD